MRIDRRTLFVSSLAGAVAAGGSARAQSAEAAPIEPLQRPASGNIRVAFVVDRGTNITDLGGPWETLGNAGSDEQHCELYTVSPNTNEISLAGINARAHYTVENAPQPHVVVMGAQTGAVTPDDATQVKVEWIRSVAPQADVIMSICTGAFLLARTGLIDGRLATTHHNFYEEFEREFPNVRLVRNRRFVDNGKFVSGGGLTSGVDAALHIVARYWGVEEAQLGAEYLEHYSDGWRTGVRESA